MSLSAQELSFLNTVGPRPAINKMGLLRFANEVYPEQGLKALDKKWLTKRKVKNEIVITAQQVLRIMLSHLFDGELNFKEVNVNAWSTTYSPASKNIQSLKSFREKSDGVSVTDFIFEAIKCADHSQMFSEDLPFKIEYEKDGLYFRITQEIPEVDEYETSRQQEERLVNIFNSYFRVWTTALDKYRDLLKALKGMEENVGLDEKIKEKIINDYLDSLQTPSHAEQFKDKITLREFVLKYA
jgi:hypothetical protein